jgi:hypothetical protein
MEVITLNSSNYIGLSATYSSDKTLTFNQNVYYTEQGIDLPLVEALAQANDSSTNNYSNLFLTQSVPLSSTAIISPLEHIPDDGFTTYLAAYLPGGILPRSNCMVVQEPPFTISTAAVSMSGLYANVNNSYFFTIKFETDSLCKIEHINAGTARYLTMGADLNLYFAFDTGTDYLGDQSPQLFYYLYNRAEGLIILSKNLQDTPHYLCFDGLSSLSALPALSGIPSYPPSAIFSCVKRSQEPNTTPLYDPWVSYQPDFLTNTQNINANKSTQSVNSNLLLNSQYLSITGTELNVNALSLKNTNTPENYQSRNNPFQFNKSQFLSEDDINLRDYKSLFTGSHQLLGDDNISLGYEAYTTDIVLKADSVTYFHVPQTLYPFKQVNIAESGLIEAGAIAGDHPVKSDEIFKKLASAKYTSPFGNTVEETNGTFLCSWLSGSGNIKATPIWVDRYYNPSRITFINALTAQSLQAITYSTAFDGLVNAAGKLTDTDEVFDVPSNLIFEPGCYYAYHHYGPSDVSNYINTFTPYLVERDFPKYYFVNGASANNGQLLGDEYNFTGDNYAITNSLTGIQDSNQFTMSFDMYNNDWTKPFGNQIIGNLLNDGFGIFNENVITPTLFINTSASTDVVNTDFVKLNTVNYTATPLVFIRPRFTENYSIVFNDGYLRQYTCDDRLLRQTFSPYLSNAISVSYTDTTAYILCPSTTTTTLLSANLISNTVTPVLTSTISSISFVADASSTNILATFPTTSAGTINYYNGNYYFTTGSNARRYDDVIYFLADNKTSIVKWDEIDNTKSTILTAFKASTAAGSYFIDFNIDFDGNIWILNNTNTFYKYTQNNQFLLSGTLTSSTPVTTTVNITGDGATTSFPLSSATTLTPYDLTVNLNNSKQRPIFDYSLSGSNIVFVNPPVNGYLGNITYTQILDTFSNSKLSFISEFAGGNYYTNTVFARTGVTYNTISSTVTALSTSPAYQFLVFDTNGTQLSSTYYFTVTGSRLALTNVNYLREHVIDTYPNANFNIKAILSNVYDSTDMITSEINYSLSALDPGYHNFAIRFDSYNGFMTLFIDSQIIKTVQFTPRKYKFSNLIYRPFLIGSSCFNNSLPLFKYLKKNSYLTENIKIKNFFLYDSPLNDYDVYMHAKLGANIQDLHFDVPCGKRNYIEEIERYFKANIPGSKSTLYNVILRNTGITDPALQAALEQRIINTLTTSAPIYSKLNTIKWVN